MKTQKIIFDAHPLIPPKSGVGYYTDGLVKALADVASPDIRLVGHYFNFLGRKHLTDLPNRSNVSYIQTRLMPGRLIGLARRIGIQPYFELLTRQKAQVVIFPNYVLLPTFYKSHSVVMVHDMSFIDCPEYVSAKNRLFLQKWVPVSIRQADTVVTISDFTKQRIINLFGVEAGKIHITPIPPPPHLKPDFSVIEKYKLAQGYVLFMGTIEPRKNIIGLLDAYELLPAKIRLAYPLVLAGGKGWNDAEILARIEKLISDGLPIIQTGYVSDAERSALYQHATLCVLPSHYEGFGMPILEAMSYNKPVACSDLAVFHEVAGEAAVYFDPNDPRDISKCIGSMLASNTKLQSYSKHSTNHIKSFPTWDAVARDFLAKIMPPT